MSRRPTALLAVLAGAAVCGCGGGTPTRHAPARSGSAVTPGSPAVAVVLHRGTSATATFCSARHHVRIYARGLRVTVTGQITPVPSGHWKVKLQIKVCRGSAYTEVGKVRAIRERQAGAFTATLGPLPAGDYAVRADLYLTSGTRVRSAKRHLVIR